MAGTTSILPVATGVVASVFTFLLLQQYLDRRKPHQLLWAVGMGLFAAASFLQFVGEDLGWDEVTYRAYYFSAQVLVGALAAGSLFLVSRRWGTYYVAACIFLAFAFLGTLVAYPIDLSTVHPNGSTSAGGQAVLGPARDISLAFTIPGTFILVGTALYSWWKTRRFYNLLIAAGIAVVATGGSIARLGIPEMLYVFNLAGIVVLFAGFMRSQEVPREQPQAVAA